MSKDSLAFLDATEQAKLIRTGEIKPIELLEDAIKRIERINPSLNAVVTKMYDEARTALENLPEGPFSGVPFLLKDHTAFYKGVPITFGSRFLKDLIPEHDSELVVRLKRAGLVILGKTNLPEFGILPTSESELFGPCRNPWNTDCTSGGSSGGAAAAVASGMVPMAHGNDGGGSIRIPASCCGVFGLKPTRARISLAPDKGDFLSGLVSEHALTRSVRDSAALLDATAGPVPGDPYWAPPQARPYIDEVGADPGKLRIAYTTEAFMDVPVHEDCSAAVHDAVRLCEDCGHEITEALPALEKDALVSAFTVLWSAGIASVIKYLGVEAGQVEHLTWALYELGSTYDAADYLHSVDVIQRISRTVANFFEKYDILITPTLAEPPPPIGSFDSPPENPLYGIARAGQFSPFTPLCNSTGQPAMSVPLYWNKSGLPIGTQFIGRFGDEATLFRLAAQLEEARPWANKRPTFDLK